MVQAKNAKGNKSFNLRVTSMDERGVEKNQVDACLIWPAFDAASLLILQKRNVQGKGYLGIRSHRLFERGILKTWRNREGRPGTKRRLWLT